MMNPSGTQGPSTIVIFSVALVLLTLAAVASFYALDAIKNAEAVSSSTAATTSPHEEPGNDTVQNAKPIDDTENAAPFTPARCKNKGHLPEDAAPEARRLPEIRIPDADHAEVVLQVPNQQRLPRRFKRKLCVCLPLLVIVAVATFVLHSFAERVEHNVHHASSSNITTAQLVPSRVWLWRHANTTAVPPAVSGHVVTMNNAPEPDATTEGPFEWPPLVQPV
ncbi:hypothetical protein MRX96_043531 [Rhipicephalus microplus]